MTRNLASTINTLLALEWVLLITVAVGGQFILRFITREISVTEHTIRYARAGHAHAGVLVALGMLLLLGLARTDIEPRTAIIVWAAWLVSALALSGGFFAHAFGGGESVSSSWGTMMAAIGGIGLMIVSLISAWMLFRSN